LLRGRISARLDLRRVVAAAKLPEPLAGLVYQDARHEAIYSAKRAE
jgi:hypothetical protein